jgi:hypothetical protein
MMAMWSSIFWDVMLSSVMKINILEEHITMLATLNMLASYLTYILAKHRVTFTGLYGTISQKKESLY